MFNEGFGYLNKIQRYELFDKMFSEDSAELLQ